jgi:hypothetical protein
MLRVLVALIMVFSLKAHPSLGGVRVIMANDKDQLNERDVVNIVNGTMLKWGDGSNINLYIEDLNKIDAESFSYKFNIAKDKFINDWRIKFFSGKASLPKQVKNIEDSLSLISEVNNSILIVFTKGDIPQDILTKKGLREVKF